MSKVYDLLLAIQARLETISPANGYQTDIGARVLIDPDAADMSNEAAPVTRLFETEAENISQQPNRNQCLMKTLFIIETQHAVEGVNPTEAAHMAIADIIRAVFGTDDRTLDSRAREVRLEGYRIVAPEAGSRHVLAQVRGSHVYVNHFNAP